MRFFLLALVASAAAYAQSVTGTIVGAVIDPTGLPIARAAVTLIQPATSFERRATTAENGSFAFPSLAPGVYNLSVKQDGFKQSERRNLNLTASETLTTGDIQLQAPKASPSTPKAPPSKPPAPSEPASSPAPKSKTSSSAAAT